MIKFSLFSIPVVYLADNFKYNAQTIEGAFSTIKIGVKHEDTVEGFNEALAATYSAMLVMNYPTPEEVPLHESASTLPSTINGEVFENSVHLRSYLTANNMKIGRNTEYGDYICHTNLLHKDWAKGHFAENPSGFGMIKEVIDIDADSWSKVPDYLRLDLTEPYLKLVRFDILEMLKTQYENEKLSLQSFVIKTNLATQFGMFCH